MRNGLSKNMEQFDLPPQIAANQRQLAYIPLRAFMRELESLQPPRSDSRRALSPKAALHRTSTSTIAQVWRELYAHIAASPETLGLANIVDGKLEATSAAQIDSEMLELYKRNWYFPPSKLRAYATRLAEYFCLRHCHNHDVDYYQTQLEGLAPYWFRRSVHEHLSTGFHTAFAVAFKLVIATAGAQALANRSLALAPLDQALERVFVLAMTLGTAHMNLLLASDGVLWDSAGAHPAPFIKYIESESGQELAIESSTLSQIKLKLQKHKKFDQEPRYGCPAMAASGIERPVLRECLNWCGQLAQRFYFNLLT